MSRLPFSSSVYQSRRNLLINHINEPILLLGNQSVGINYKSNSYRFVQDSTFLYFAGLNLPNLVIYIHQEEVILFGNEFTVESAVWTGPLPTLRDQAAEAGISKVLPLSEMKNMVASNTHFLPPYRGNHTLLLSDLLNIPPSKVEQNVSQKLIRAVINQRIIKSEQEISYMEDSLAVTKILHETLMNNCLTGKTEAELHGLMLQTAASHGCTFSYRPIITKNGQILHNETYLNTLSTEDMVLADMGVQTAAGYASDITRTFPVDGKFVGEQQFFYELTLKAQQQAIQSIKSNANFLSIHVEAATVIAEGMIDAGFFNGDAAEVVHSGAYALAFSHGLGHAIGLDVHDMENLGEDNVGYNGEISRSDKFGMAYLRFGGKLSEGMVMTVEPGIYFIPELIASWKKQNKFPTLINYSKFEEYSSFGGIRIEDNILVTKDSYRILGEPIAKSVEEITK